MGVSSIQPDDLAETARTYHDQLDTSINEALARLENDGITAPCGEGCAWCCFIPIRATLPEAALIARYIHENFSATGEKQLKRSIESWLSWSETEVPYYLEQGIDLSSVYRLYGPGCPMLSDGLCVVYPVRPMGCRVHFCHDPEHCKPASDEQAEVGPFTLIQETVKPVCMDYRVKLEAMGIGFEKTLDFLPVTVLAQLAKTR